MAFAGFVEADSTPKLLHGQSPPMTAVMSSIGHHFLPVKSIYQQPPCMTYFIITSPQTSPASSVSPHLELGRTPSQYYANTPLSTHIGILFINSIYFQNCIPFNILSVPRHLLHNFLCSNNMLVTCRQLLFVLLPKCTGCLFV